MYYYIKGKFIKSCDNFIVVDAGGIGYKLYTSSPTIDKMPESGTDITVYTHLHIKEDAHDLYGFLTNEELTLFLQLLSVSGVGPKAALAILSVASPEKFALAVITNDLKTITKAQGVGPKVAQRIILELKDKLKTEAALPENVSDIIADTENNQAEAVTALVVLGYTSNEAKRAVSRIDSELSTEEIIKEALKLLMKQV